MPTFTGRLVNYPARTSFIWFAGLILVGACLLWLPFSRGSAAQQPISVMEALFTSTSAACVTGLTVRDTGSEFSLIGQMVIAGLIQLGGIGILTITNLITLQFAKRTTLRSRAVVAETVGTGEANDVRHVLRAVILYSLLVEGIGFAVLAGCYLYQEMSVDALWAALFHSISAFCNAGFGLHPDNLTRFHTHWVYNLCIMFLIVFGGIGYPVVLDIERNRKHGLKMLWHKMHLHSKLMLIGTVFLLTSGGISMALLEWNMTFKEFSISEKFLAGFFHSTSARTAGFNTVDVGKMSQASLFVLIMLMFVGGGPCSTAGGMKVSTMMVLVCRAWSSFRGKRKLHVFKRTISQANIERATVTAILFGVAAAAGTLSLLIAEHELSRGHSQSALMFEVVSALCTVGLSTGITAKLSIAAWLCLILLMFLGRLGPITVFAALAQQEGPTSVEYPTEEPLVG